MIDRLIDDAERREYGPFSLCPDNLVVMVAAKGQEAKKPPEADEIQPRLF